MIIIKKIFISVYILSSIHSQEIPEPHRKALDKIMLRYVNKQTYSGSMMDVLFGGPGAQNVENLGVNVLDRKGLNNIIRMVNKNYNNATRMARENATRSTIQNAVQDAPKRYPVSNDTRRTGNYWAERIERTFYRKNRAITRKAFQQMRQSIYFARDSLQQSNPFRKKFGNDPSYQIGFMVMNIRDIMVRCENYYAILQSLNKPHFLWPLVLYEKTLAGHTDIVDMARRIFKLHAKYKMDTDDLIKSVE